MFDASVDDSSMYAILLATGCSTAGLTAHGISVVGAANYSQNDLLGAPKIPVAIHTNGSSFIFRYSCTRKIAKLLVASPLSRKPPCCQRGTVCQVTAETLLREQRYVFVGQRRHLCQPCRRARMQSSCCGGISGESFRRNRSVS